MILRRRDFLLSAAAVPAAALVPLRSGSAPLEFYGFTLERPGAYLSHVEITGAGVDDCRVMLDDLELLGFRPGRDSTCVFAASTFIAHEGQLFHIDVGVPATVRFTVRRV